MTFSPNLQVLTGPGFWIMVLGFAAVLLGRKLAGLFGTAEPEKTAMLIKGIGCAAVILGAVLVFV